LVDIGFLGYMSSICSGALSCAFLTPVYQHNNVSKIWYSVD